MKVEGPVFLVVPVFLVLTTISIVDIVVLRHRRLHTTFKRAYRSVWTMSRSRLYKVTTAAAVAALAPKPSLRL